MKTFDIHIGVSDAMLLPTGDFPDQFSIERAETGELDIFCGMMCPIVFNGQTFVLPEDIKGELEKHLSFYKSFGEKGPKVILGIEGIYFIKSEKDLEFLDSLIDRGVKIVGPVWNFESNLFAKEKVTELGKKFLKRCKEKNVILDLAHSESSIFDLLIDNFDGPVISSHTNLHYIKKHRRNISDGQIKKIIDLHGLIGISFVGEFLGGNSLEDVVLQITTYVQKFGDDSLCIGSDFDGMEQSDVVTRLSDVSEYGNLQMALLKNGLNKDTVEKIFSGNAYKFFKKIYG